MVRMAFVVVLALLWALTLVQPGGSDFLRARVIQQGFVIVRVIDVLTGLAIVGLMVSMPGPLALTGAVLFALWLAALVGLPQMQGLAVAPLVVLIVIIGATVHIVTHRSH